jgi:hypothetical protein
MNKHHRPRIGTPPIPAFALIELQIVAASFAVTTRAGG